MTIAAMDDIAPTDSGAAPSLDHLLARIDHARWRVLAGSIMASAGSAAAVALATFCLLRLVVAMTERAVPFGDLVLVSSAMGVATLLATVTRAVLGRPSRGTMARRADIAFALQERVSTAVELSAQGMLGPVSRALLSDAAARAAGISARALAPFRMPRGTVALVGLALFASALLLAPLPERTMRATEAPQLPAAVLTAAEATAFADELHRIATAMEAEAEVRNDAYLGAVAREVNETAQRLDAGVPIEREALGDDLDRLRDYATRAYGGGAEAATATAGLGRLAAAAETGATPRTTIALEDVPTAVPIGALAAGVEETGSPGNGPGGPGGNDDPPRPPTMFGQIAPGPNAIAPAGGEIEAFDIDGYPVLPPCTGADCGATGGNETATPGNANAPPGAGAPEAPAGNGTPAAPAPDGGAGDGVGDGTRPLGDIPLPALADMPDAGTMLLPDAGTGTAQRIRMSVPPQPGGVTLAEADRPAGVNWRTLAEQPVARTLLPPAERDISARYFARAAGNRP